MKELTEEEAEESVILFRATVKLSSALTNFDTLNDGEFSLFQKKFKRDFINYAEWLENHLKPLTNIYSKQDPEVLADIMYWFIEIEDHVESADPYDKEILLFFAKIFSACDDMKPLVDKEAFLYFCEPIFSRSRTLFGKNYLRIFEFLSFEHSIFKNVVEQMNELGRKVVI